MIESQTWRTEEERKGKTAASSSCHRKYILMEKMIRDLGWRRLNEQQMEEKLKKYLKALYSRVNVLVKIDSESNGYLNESE